MDILLGFVASVGIGLLIVGSLVFGVFVTYWFVKGFAKFLKWGFTVTYRPRRR